MLSVDGSITISYSYFTGSNHGEELLIGFQYGRQVAKHTFDQKQIQISNGQSCTQKKSIQIGTKYIEWLIFVQVRFGMVRIVLYISSIKIVK